MNVLVIGGSGLFGGKTVLHLARDPEISRVVSLDVVRPKDFIVKSFGEHAEKFTFVRGDVGNLESLLDVIRAHGIDRLVNLAFILPGAIETQPRLSVLVNQLGMSNAFEAARLMGIGRVVYASSEGVYGPQAEYGDRDVTEDDEMHPQSTYAIGKQLSELLAAQYTDLYGLSMTAIRPPIGYGHGGRIPNVIRWFSDIVSLPAAGKPFSVEVDGNGRHSLGAADDIAAFIRILIKAPSSPHPAYNLGGPPLTLRDVAAAVQRYIPDANIEFGPRPEEMEAARGGLPYRLSMARAEADFGYRTMPLEEAVLIHINDARLEAGLPPLVP
jgi:UDP-glucose 4-epimerase